MLGANDGIVSTAKPAGRCRRGRRQTGEAASTICGRPFRMSPALMSMAAGEYVSVSSQSDTENADLELERQELATMPDRELRELQGIYRESRIGRRSRCR